MDKVVYTISSAFFITNILYFTGYFVWIPLFKLRSQKAYYEGHMDIRADNTAVLHEMNILYLTSFSVRSSNHELKAVMLLT